MEGAESITKIESENFKLQNDEYLLDMTLYSDDFIEFKITQNGPTASCYYIEKFNLDKINKISFMFCEDMKKVYQIYKKIINDNKINLILSQDKNIMIIHYKTLVNNYKEKDVNLELKKMALEKEDVINILKKEYEENKKKSKNYKKKMKR